MDNIRFGFGRHSAWLLNRHQVSQGATNFELVHGQSYFQP